MGLEKPPFWRTILFSFLKYKSCIIILLLPLHTLEQKYSKCLFGTCRSTCPPNYYTPFKKYTVLPLLVWINTLSWNNWHKFFVRSAAFMATLYNKIYLGYKPCKMVKRWKNQHFKDHLYPHHQGTLMTRTKLVSTLLHRPKNKDAACTAYTLCT
jgi:hypothetical protein